MSTQALQITELTPKAGAIHQVSRAWAALPVPKGIVQRRVYEALDGSSVLELAALEEMGDLAALQPSWSVAWNMLGPDMASDFRRQIVTFVEAPKDTTDSLPATPYVQLRHVEVPPGNFSAYRAWRERTIFDVVRSAPQVEVFLAYHSALSTEPGVMFVAGFSSAIDEYSAVFNSPRYQEIIREAGNQFITGGSNGLYTRIYRHVPAN